MRSAADCVTLIQAESTRLKQYLHALPRTAWSQPSACAQWQIQDVVAHLVFNAEDYIAFLSRGLQGDTSPPEGAPPAGTRNAVSSAEGVSRRTIARREQLGDQVLAAFETTDDTLNHLLASLGPQEWETRCYHPGGVFPARWFRDMRLSELVIHGWDIRSRFAPDVPLSPESLPVLMDLLATLTPGWAFAPGGQLATPVCYRFAVTGTSPGTIDIVVTGDTARIAETRDAWPDVTFRCDTETYVLMRYGRLRLADALATGRVVVEGDQALATAFGQWFKGI
jgi:uncharacterized protein (TIGR03083 family)